MSRENHKIFQNLKSAYFTGFSGLQLWVQLWGGCNEGKTIRGVLYTDLMKVLQSKKIEAVIRQPLKCHHFLSLQRLFQQ